MAFDTVIDKVQFESALTASANAIREKTGSTDSIAWLADKGFADAIDAIEVGGGSSDEEWFNDGDTHIWITLHEGRISPMLGVGVDGTVTVDWGDGTEPDVLTGNSVYTTVWSPVHNYAEPGDYVIRLTNDGDLRIAGSLGTSEKARILRHSNSADGRNTHYLTCVKKVEVGSNRVSVMGRAFYGCHSMTSILLPEGLSTFQQNEFDQCYSLKTVVIPNGVDVISVEMFGNCVSIETITIPNSVTRILNNAFAYCTSLTNIVIPSSVKSIRETPFLGCHGLRYIDFTQHTAVPTLDASFGISSLSADLEIRVPAALYDEWIAATNWSDCASRIVAV